MDPDVILQAPFPYPYVPINFKQNITNWYWTSSSGEKFWRIQNHAKLAHIYWIYWNTCKEGVFKCMSISNLLSTPGKQHRKKGNKKMMVILTGAQEKNY